MLGAAGPWASNGGSPVKDGPDAVPPTDRPRAADATAHAERGCAHCGGSGVRCCEFGADRPPLAVQAPVLGGLRSVEAPVLGRPLPTVARVAPLTWLIEDMGLPFVTAATLIDSVADVLEQDRLDDALARGRLVLDEVAANRLVATIVGAAAHRTAA